MEDKFKMVGIKPVFAPEITKKKRRMKGCSVSVAVLTVIVLGCLMCDLFTTKDPSYMDLYNTETPPNAQFLFGTDTLGRDMFSMIWYGGRISLLIGFLAAAISFVIAIVYGSLSALAPKWVDSLMMRSAEIFLSIPNLLVVILLGAVFGKGSVLKIAFIIGITGWMSMAKVVRTEVRRIRECEYVIAARCMGAGFFRILTKHLVPNFFSSVMFMAVMNIRSAIVCEATLSFMGIGLPIEVVSWGSMLSLAERSLLSDSWWIILIPGAFLTVTLLCITNIANCLRKEVSRRHSNL